MSDEGSVMGPEQRGRAGGDPKPPQCHVGEEPGWEATVEKSRNQRVR